MCSRVRVCVQEFVRAFVRSFVLARVRSHAHTHTDASMHAGDEGGDNPVVAGSLTGWKVNSFKILGVIMPFRHCFLHYF